MNIIRSMDREFAVKILREDDSLELGFTFPSTPSKDFFISIPYDLNEVKWEGREINLKNILKHYYKYSYFLSQDNRMKGNIIDFYFQLSPKLDKRYWDIISRINKLLEETVSYKEEEE